MTTWTERAEKIEAMRTGRGYSLAKHNAQQKFRREAFAYLTEHGVEFQKYLTLESYGQMADEVAAR